jgi:hypothetical protein
MPREETVTDRDRGRATDRARATDSGRTPDGARTPDRDRAYTADRELERKGRRMGHSGSWFVVVGLLIAIPGIVLVLIDHGWSIGVGVAILLIASVPSAIGVGLLVSAAVSRWAARRKLFA